MSQQDPSQLTLQTLINALNIIDVCTQRNAYKTDELELVGKTYNNLKTFITYTQKQAEQQSVQKQLSEVENKNNTLDSIIENAEQENTTDNDVNVI